MQPGRELDALIAEKVMGWSTCMGNVYYTMGPAIGRQECTSYPVVAFIRPDGNKIEIVPYYSTEIAHAWEVVEKLLADGLYLDIKTNSSHLVEANIAHGFAVRFIQAQGRYLVNWHWQVSEYVPHAICLAALKTLEFQKETPEPLGDASLKPLVEK